MKLSDVLAALANNANLNISLIDSNDKNLVTFNCDGWESIENDITAREVKKILIVSSSAVKIFIADAANP